MSPMPSASVTVRATRTLLSKEGQGRPEWG